MTIESATWTERHADYIEDTDDITPMYGVRLLVGINSDGLPAYVVQFDNPDNVDAFQLAGFLEMLKMEVLRDHMRDALERTR